MYLLVSYYSPLQETSKVKQLFLLSVNLDSCILSHGVHVVHFQPAALHWCLPDESAIEAVTYLNDTAGILVDCQDTVKE